jgi:single-strand DNA-binding protein
MNNVSLVGRLTKENDMRYSPSGTAVLRNTLAVNRKKKDETDFINILAFGKTAELIANHLNKGDQVGFTGHIQTGSYEKDGRKIYTTEVVVDGVVFIGSKKQQIQQNKPVTDPFGDAAEIQDSELPF